jgi:hypothetical protein
MTLAYLRLECSLYTIAPPFGPCAFAPMKAYKNQNIARKGAKAQRNAKSFLFFAPFAYFASLRETFDCAETAAVPYRQLQVV